MADSEASGVSRQAVVTTLKRKGFYLPWRTKSGTDGYYDLAPPATEIKSKVISFWKKHFKDAEDMEEVMLRPTTVPDQVDKVIIVKDEKSGDIYRADHLLKVFCNNKLKDNPDAAASLNKLSSEMLGALINQYGLLAPNTKNPLSDPYTFELPNSIRPRIQPYDDVSIGYMPPELEHGIHNLYDHLKNQCVSTFYQIGQAFKNEISPQKGLICVREFTHAIIVHFLDTSSNSHPKFQNVSDLKLLFVTENEPANRLCLREGIENNQTLAYFTGIVSQFLTRIGIPENCLRFRHHPQNEMVVDYVLDRWDAEIQCSYGWIDCVEFSFISAATDPPTHWKIDPQKQVLTDNFSADDYGKVCRVLKEMNETEVKDMKCKFDTDNKEGYTINGYLIKESMVKFKPEAVKEQPRLVLSFSLGRIIHCLFEHSFFPNAGDENLNAFRFSLVVAPITCTFLMLNQQHKEASKLLEQSKNMGLSTNMKIVTDASIEKAYASLDELGVPLVVVMEKDDLVRLHERVSKQLVHMKGSEVLRNVESLSDGTCTWADIFRRYSS